jgi:biopolymer transport protein ExbD
MFDLTTSRARRRPSLTPMIDVVFLLLVFFMLAARFGVEGTIEVVLSGGEAADPWRGPPRLIEVRPESVTLNGVPTDEAGLADALTRLVEGKSDPVLIRAGEGAALQRMVTVMERLGAAGYTRLVLVE